jgi:tetratricopeptide (TPR) repeat protein
MKGGLAITGTLLAASLAAAALLVRPAHDGPTPAGIERAIAGLAQRLDRLGAEQERIASALQRGAPGRPSPAGECLTEDDATALFDRLLAERLAAGAEDRLARLRPDGVRPRRVTAETHVDEVITWLYYGDGPESRVGYERDLLWQEIREAGRLDEIVTRIEARAGEDPADLDMQLRLAEVYGQKAAQYGTGPMAGLWANKTDAVFDHMLEIDENHWAARFYKATTLSLWPPIFGKQPEAIRQFEILIDKQGDLPEAPHFAQTYLALGNLYQQKGDTERALEVWMDGLDRFPDSQALQTQVDLVAAE